MKHILVIAAVIAWSTPGSAQTLIPQPWQGGGYELRDTDGSTTGYLVPDQASGRYEIRDMIGRVRGYLTPNQATGAVDLDLQPDFDRVPGKHSPR
jgi:hypothetical protein